MVKEQVEEIMLQAERKADTWTVLECGFFASTGTRWID